MNILTSVIPSNDSGRLVEAFKVKVKRGAGWQQESVCRLHISVGQPYHEGDKFRATMDWARDNFDHVIVCVNDTLQRHNRIFDGETPELALENSKQAGEAWIQRNTTPEERVSTQVNIFRWEDWLALPNYQETLEAVKAEYEAGGVVKDVIEAEIVSFWERVKQRNGLKTDFKFPSFQAHSREYLLEECAVFSMMFKRDKAADVYPGSTLVPCQLYKDVNDRKSKGFTRIDFSSVKVDSCSVLVPRDEAERIVFKNGRKSAIA